MIITDMKTKPTLNNISGSCAHCGKAVWESLFTLDDCYNVWMGRCPHCKALNFLSMNHGLRGYSSVGMNLVLPTPEEKESNELPDGIPLAPSNGPATSHGSPLGEFCHQLTHKDTPEAQP